MKRERTKKKKEEKEGDSLERTVNEQSVRKKHNKVYICLSVVTFYKPPNILDV